MNNGNTRDVEKKNNRNVQELFALLERMEKRPAEPEVMEGYSNTADVITLSDDQEDETLLMPQTENNALPELLINPDEMVDEEEQAASQEIVHLLQTNLSEKDDDEEELPPPPADRRNPFLVMWGLFCAGLPHREDGGPVIAVKTGSLVAAVALLAAVVFLVAEMAVFPYQNRQMYDRLEEMYYSNEKEHQIVSGEEYPAGTLTSFKQLYLENKQVRGWLSFHASGSDFLDIEYPVVQGESDRSYTNHDFYKNVNQNGCLYFDQDSRIHRTETSKVLIVHGNNVVSGQMLSNLNKLMGNVNNARCAAHFTLSTLYEKADYLVFAVMLLDDSSSDFTLRTTFESEDDFLSYTTQLRARSLFQYPAADTSIYSSDELAMLTVPVSASGSHIDHGRLVVVGRRRRVGESNMNTGKIIKNADVVMPYQWYVNQDLNPHEEYYISAMNTATTTTTTATPPMGDTITTDPTAETDPTSATGPTDSTQSTAITGSSVNPATSITGSSTSATGSTTSTTKSTTKTTAKTTAKTEPSQSTPSNNETPPAGGSDTNEPGTPNPEEGNEPNVPGDPNEE